MKIWLEGITEESVSCSCGKVVNYGDSCWYLHDERMEDIGQVLCDVCMKVKYPMLFVMKKMPF